MVSLLGMVRRTSRLHYTCRQPLKQEDPLKEADIEIVEKNIIGNLQLCRRMLRKLRSKGFQRVYGHDVSLVGEALIKKDDGVEDESAAIKWLLARWDWMKICLVNGGFSFLKRVLDESKMPEVYKGYIVARILSTRDPGLCFELDVPRCDVGHDCWESVAEVLDEMEGHSSSEVLMRLGNRSISIDINSIDVLARKDRWDVIDFMLDDDEPSFTRICSPQSLASIVMWATEFWMFDDVENCWMNGLGYECLPAEDSYLTGLRLVHHHFPGELEQFCMKIREQKPEGAS